MAAGIPDDPAAIVEQLRRVKAQIDKLTDAVANTGNRSLAERLDALEWEQDGRAQRAECVEKAQLHAAALMN